MKVQTLNENLTKSLSSIKESKVNICGVVVNRKPLLEALKVNKDLELITLETGKVSWSYLSDKNEVLKHAEVVDKPALRIRLGNKIRMDFLHQSEIDTKCVSPAKLDFTFSTEKSGIALDTRKLIDALTYVLPACATEENRIVLTCVVFDCSPTGITLASADGYRLHTTKFEATGLTEKRLLIPASEINQALIPFLKSIKPIGKGKSKYYPEVYFSYTDNTATFSTDKGHTELYLLDGTYPSYEKLIPDSCGSKIEFIASDMLQALKSLKNVATYSTGIVRLKFANSQCHLAAKSDEYGDAESTIDCKVNQDCQIALNIKYLIDLLSICKAELVTAYITTDSSPLKIELCNNRVAVLMPMFVQW